MGSGKVDLGCVACGAVAVGLLMGSGGQGQGSSLGLLNGSGGVWCVRKVTWTSLYVGGSPCSRMGVRGEGGPRSPLPYPTAPTAYPMLPMPLPLPY
jgi:hypothetical protein